MLVLLDDRDRLVPIDFVNHVAERLGLESSGVSRFVRRAGPGRRRSGCRQLKAVCGAPASGGVG